MGRREGRATGTLWTGVRRGVATAESVSKQILMVPQSYRDLLHGRYFFRWQSHLLCTNVDIVSVLANEYDGLFKP